MSGVQCANCGTLIGSYPCAVCNHDRPATLTQQAGLKSMPKAGLLATSGLVPVAHACQLIVE